MKIGAHISIAGGITNVFERAQNIGAEAVQIFASPPQNWNKSTINQANIEQYIKLSKTTNITPTFIHAIYLINLVSDNPVLVKKSAESLVDYLTLSSKLEAAGVIVHIGSSKAGFESIKASLVDAINQILNKTPDNSTLIFETNAGSGFAIGSSFDQIAAIINASNNKKRLGVCLDTAHVYSSGYDIKNDTSDVFRQFDKIIGLRYLKTIHANDSKSSLGSHIDRHENIGEGTLGTKTFQNILQNPSLQNIPIILEVPGFSNQGPDLKNIDLLKSLRQSAA